MLPCCCADCDLCTHRKFSDLGTGAGGTLLEVWHKNVTNAGTVYCFAGVLDMAVRAGFLYVLGATTDIASNVVMWVAQKWTLDGVRVWSRKIEFTPKRIDSDGVRTWVIGSQLLCLDSADGSTLWTVATAGNDVEPDGSGGVFVARVANRETCGDNLDSTYGFVALYDPTGAFVRSFGGSNVLQVQESLKSNEAFALLVLDGKLWVAGESTVDFCCQGYLQTPPSSYPDGGAAISPEYVIRSFQTHLARYSFTGTLEVAVNSDGYDEYTNSNHYVGPTRVATRLVATPGGRLFAGYLGKGTTLDYGVSQGWADCCSVVEWDPTTGAFVNGWKLESPTEGTGTDTAESCHTQTVISMAAGSDFLVMSVRRTASTNTSLSVLTGNGYLVKTDLSGAVVDSQRHNGTGHTGKVTDAPWFGAVHAVEGNYIAVAVDALDGIYAGGVQAGCELHDDQWDEESSACDPGYFTRCNCGDVPAYDADSGLITLDKGVLASFGTLGCDDCGTGSDIDNVATIPCAVSIRLLWSDCATGLPTSITAYNVYHRAGPGTFSYWIGYSSGIWIYFADVCGNAAWPKLWIGFDTSTLGTGTDSDIQWYEACIYAKSCTGGDGHPNLKFFLSLANYSGHEVSPIIACDDEGECSVSQLWVAGGFGINNDTDGESLLCAYGGAECGPPECGDYHPLTGGIVTNCGCDGETGVPCSFDAPIRVQCGETLYEGNVRWTNSAGSRTVWQGSATISCGTFALTATLSCAGTGSASNPSDQWSISGTFFPSGGGSEVLSMTIEETWCTAGAPSVVPFPGFLWSATGTLSGCGSGCAICGAFQEGGTCDIETGVETGCCNVPTNLFATLTVPFCTDLNGDVISLTYTGLSGGYHWWEGNFTPTGCGELTFYFNVDDGIGCSYRMCIKDGGGTTLWGDCAAPAGSLTCPFVDEIYAPAGVIDGTCMFRGVADPNPCFGTIAATVSA